MNETITISRKDYDSLLRTLGRADACVSYILHEQKQGFAMVDEDICLEILGVKVPKPTVTVEEESSGGILDFG